MLRNQLMRFGGMTFLLVIPHLVLSPIKYAIADSDAAVSSPIHREESPWERYWSASQALHDGQDRQAVATMFADVARRWPDDSLGKIAAELARELKAMAAEDAAFVLPEDPAALDEQQRLSVHIHRLRDVAEMSPFVPGRTNVLFYPTTPDSAALALRRMGKPAVAPLIELLENRRPTRSIAGLMNSDHVLRYGDVALQIIEAIAARQFDTQTARGAFLLNAEPDVQRQIIARVRQWWAENHDKSESQWLRESIEERGIGPNWDRLEAARRLIELDGRGAIDLLRQRQQAEPDNPHIPRLIQMAEGGD